jgi:hypothetical protein
MLPSFARCRQRVEERLELFNRLIQRCAGLVMQNRGDVFIEVRVLRLQREDGNADDGDDELQPPHVLAHADGELLIQCWVER